jgi:hypothetical protein
MSEGINRRTALSVLASGGAASLTAACRAVSGGDDQAIRSWFREHHDIELDDASLAPIRDYLRKAPTPSDPSMQPPLLFDPEVDVG